MISIVIPHFERLELLRETLEWVVRQTRSDWEVLLVDDGSNAAVWSEIQQLASASVTVLQRTDGHKGPSRCRNLGLQAARGKFILFLDSDDLLAPRCVENRLQAIHATPDRDFWVFPVELFRNIPGDLRQPWNTMSSTGDELPRFLRSDGPWCVSSSCWRKSALQTIGGFNEAVMYGDDADLHIRALLAGLRFETYAAAPPDIFIRRSDAPRITGSGCSPALLESRMVRLTEGYKALVAAGAGPELLRIWEGQYFMEGEFLLFNQPSPGLRLTQLIEQWQQHYPRGNWQQKAAALYLRWSSFWLHRWYLQVRLARKAMLRLLPDDWFQVHRTSGAA
jgi:glycosyltransferase involved in cell wall biosynthesis